MNLINGTAWYLLTLPSKRHKCHLHFYSVFTPTFKHPIKICKIQSRSSLIDFATISFIVLLSQSYLEHILPIVRLDIVADQTLGSVRRCFAYDDQSGTQEVSLHG